MRTLLLLSLFSGSLILANAQTTATSGESPAYRKAEKVNFDDYLKLAAEVQEYRKDRLVSFSGFNSMAAGPNTIILDTRSLEMYNAAHLKGAIHLNFSDFNSSSLAQLIPSRDTRILIYCNNNFIYQEPLEISLERFTSKSAPPIIDVPFPGITLALNIPTFINLYGYGYQNVYELGEEVIILPGIAGNTIFEGTDYPSQPADN